MSIGLNLEAWCCIVYIIMYKKRMANEKKAIIIHYPLHAYNARTINRVIEMRLSSFVCVYFIHRGYFVLVSLILHLLFRLKCMRACACVCAAHLLGYMCKMTNSPLLSTVYFITITDTVPSSLLLIFIGIRIFNSGHGSFISNGE